MRPLGRLANFDERSRSFAIRHLVEVKKPRSYTWRCTTYLDQGQEGTCVGFSCAHELAARPVEIKVDAALARSIYLDAQRIDPWPGGCVDMETTCLTDRGWLGPDELSVGDMLLAFDIEAEALRWSPVERVHSYEMPYRVWSHNGFAAAVTDNHRWAVRSRSSQGPYEMVQTDGWQSTHEFPRASACSDLPETQKWDDNFVELVAWVITEGHYRSSGPGHRTGVDLYQKVHLDRVQGLMDRLGVTSRGADRDGCQSWHLSGDLARLLCEVAPDRAPTMDWLCSLTLRQLHLFIDVTILADGVTDAETTQRRERRSFVQKSGPILDSWLAACALAGVPVSRRGNNRGSCSNVEVWGLRSGSGAVAVRKLASSPYLFGRVWCPQTEVGTFVARRGASVFITGNSYPGAKPYYEGSSVLAGAKVLQNRGFIPQYRWAFGLQDLILSVGYMGPAIIGVNWYESMFDTGPDYFVRIGGDVAGGHAIMVRGVSVPRQAFVLHNSWGTSWGRYGQAYLSWTDMERLLYEDGEAVVPLSRAYA